MEAFMNAFHMRLFHLFTEVETATFYLFQITIKPVLFDGNYIGHTIIEQYNKFEKSLKNK